MKLCLPILFGLGDLLPQGKDPSLFVFEHFLQYLSLVLRLLQGLPHEVKFFDLDFPRGFKLIMLRLRNLGFLFQIANQLFMGHATLHQAFHC